MNKDFIKATAEYLFLSEEPRESDVIFIPGGASPLLPLHAARLYKEGCGSIVVPSGMYSIKRGKFSGQGDFLTECEFFCSILREKGVPDSAIIKEDKAKYTYQNALFSKQLLDKMGIYPKTAILVCRSYHARRAYTYYQSVFDKTRFCVCPAPCTDITKDNWHTTEKGRRAVLGELSRLGEQMESHVKNIGERECKNELPIG